MCKVPRSSSVMFIYPRIGPDSHLESFFFYCLYQTPILSVYDIKYCYYSLTQLVNWYSCTACLGFVIANVPAHVAIRTPCTNFV